MGPGRLELPTSRLSGVRSDQLSYGPLARQHDSEKQAPIQCPQPALACPVSATPCSSRLRAGQGCGFPRKEVIQPQLPLQLPCYDFVPVTSPALGGSAPKVRFPTSGMTSFHDVTGGVYKARERIHRRVLTGGY